MAGTIEGGRNARETNIRRYGPGFYARIGARGGHNGHTGGFAWMKEHDPKRLSSLGSRGGRRSHRGPAKKRIVSK